MHNKKSLKVFFMFLFLGTVIGGALGNLISKIPESLPRSSFLNTAKPFEMSIGMNEAVRNQDGTVKEYIEREPIYIDLGIVSFRFGFAWRFNFMSIVGLVIAFIMYKKVRI